MSRIYSRRQVEAYWLTAAYLQRPQKILMNSTWIAGGIPRNWRLTCATGADRPYPHKIHFLQHLFYNTLCITLDIT